MVIHLQTKITLGSAGAWNKIDDQDIPILSTILKEHRLCYLAFACGINSVTSYTYMMCNYSSESLGYRDYLVYGVVATYPSGYVLYKIELYVSSGEYRVLEFAYN